MVNKYPNHPTEEIIDESPSVDETQSIQIVDRTGYPVLTFDADDYRDYVQDMGLGESQEQELLGTLWSIIVQFVDLGFGIEPVQRAKSNIPCSSEDKASTDGSRETVVGVR